MLKNKEPPDGGFFIFDIKIFFLYHEIKTGEKYVYTPFAGSS